jgi:hypothetical protein
MPFRAIIHGHLISTGEASGQQWLPWMSHDIVCHYGFKPATPVGRCHVNSPCFRGGSIIARGSKWKGSAGQDVPMPIYKLRKNSNSGICFVETAVDYVLTPATPIPIQPTVSLVLHGVAWRWPYAKTRPQECDKEWCAHPCHAWERCRCGFQKYKWTS